MFERVLRGAVSLLVIVASLFVVSYVAISVTRMSYPYALEWIEGASVVQVERVLNGQSLYVPPSIEYTPLLYTPLYFQVSALVAAVTGNGFLPLRAVSFIASLGCFLLIFAIVHRRSGSPAAALLAVGLYAATFPVVGGWFDLARVDSLSLSLLLGAMHAFEGRRTFVRCGVAPLLLFLAVATKQSALIAAAGLCAGALLTSERRQRLWLPLIFGLLTAGAVGVGNALTSGWYGYYVFDLPTRHGMLPEWVVRFWTHDLLWPFGIAIGIGMVALASPGPGAPGRPGLRLRDVCVVGGVVASSWLSRMHVGGFDNVLMPALAVISIYFGIGWSRLVAMTQGRNAVRLMAVLAVAAQFGALAYRPWLRLPSDEERGRMDAVARAVSAFDGEVYVPAHPWLTGQLGRRTHAHEAAVRDVLKATGPNPWADALRAEMREAVTDRRFDAIVLDREAFALRPAEFDEHYELAASFSSPGRPERGVRGRSPRLLYVPRARE